MRLFKISTMSLLFVFAIAFFVSIDSLEAQRPWISKNGINRANRFAGNWFSDGYHVRNPGPFVGYYQPWSRHNTASFSRWQKGGLGQDLFQDANPIHQNERQFEIVPSDPTIDQQKPNLERPGSNPIHRRLLPEKRQDQPQGKSTLYPHRSRQFLRLKPPSNSRGLHSITTQQIQSQKSD